MFTSDTWKEAAGQKLQELSVRLQRRQEDVPYLVYGTLAGLTLWPLVETAVTTNQLAPVIGAIYGTAAGVGANLLANQIEAWKNRATPPDEDEVADWVCQQIAANDELRQTLDTVLEKLDAISQAQAHLSATDRAWFAQTLEAELARLGNRERFAASLEGSGAIAQGEGATAIGERGVQVGNVSGHIITGDDTRLVEAGHYIEHYYEADPTAAADNAAMRQAYLGRLLREAGQLSLAGIDPKAASDESEARFNLAAVYTVLLTFGTGEPGAGGMALLDRPAKPRSLSALAQLNRHQHLVLLGDPGSGKSTFVNFVALCLAGENLGRADVNLETMTAPLPDDEGHDQEERQSWEHGPLLPLRVILRDLAARGLPEDPGQTATADHLWRFLEKEPHTAAFASLLQRELARNGGLILLDGLDEVPAARQRRAQMKQLVEDLAATLPRARILVTSRTYAYQKQDWQLSGFSEAVLAPFTTGQIRRFVTCWYGHISTLRHLHERDAQRRAERLRQAIFASDRLQGLAERPLLLTLMASLHAWRGGSLPEKREELYDNTVDLLLDWWESPKVVTDKQGQEMRQPSLAEWLKIDREKVRALLHRLAYQAHADQPELVGTADIAEDELVPGLLALSRNPDVKPRRLIEYLSNRAGLLVPHGVGIYTFPHRTFQEYLAACHLANLEHLDLLTKLTRADPNRWREVLLLAAAKSERGFTSSIWLFVDSLCSGDLPPTNDCSTNDLWGAHLAAQALAETADLEQLNPANRRKVTRLQNWLLHILRGDQLPATERAAAAVHLATLGDPRPEVMTVDEMQFCLVPQGPFWLGSDEDNWLEKDAERPLHELDIPYDYWLGRYPVTNAQFGAFVADGGYLVESYWPEAKAADMWREGQLYGYTWLPEKQEGEWFWRARPYDYGRPFNLPNHPAVGLNWYEALAFARWLTARWRAAGWLPGNWVVQLPSEAEWEKAARGGQMIPTKPYVSPIAASQEDGDVPLCKNPWPQRRFPWGDDPAEPEHANYEETGIGSTSGVGCFPAGRSVYGSEEIAGNVLEWTRSLWGRYDREKSKDENLVFDPLYSYPYVPDYGREKLDEDLLWARVLRGGVWEVDEDWLRCAYRYWFVPHHWSYLFGFRVVASLSLVSGSSDL